MIYGIQKKHNSVYTSEGHFYAHHTIPDEVVGNSCTHHIDNALYWWNGGFRSTTHRGIDSLMSEQNYKVVLHCINSKYGGICFVY